ncbi:hypothetical protein [Saccharibacillus sp. JS10]|uniref:hypothetical protein n=1 Tax=Saccharibacillus sp. JS10 TaxID=2950552 RepID=UPI00210A0208|nr:hypothetical protein [Saccharibacillus sp. JS10]MCQ4085985.1 hypothetical protein [Saccharibacillus sp. JS10]
MNKFTAQLQVSWLRTKMTIWIVLGLIVVSFVADFTINQMFVSNPQQDIAEAVGELREVTGNNQLEIQIPADVENVNVSPANLLLLLLPILGIALPLKTFRPMMNFGDSRRHYFVRLLMIYGFVAVLLALFNSLWFPLDKSGIREYVQTYNIIEVFGWNQFGAIGIFFYQVCFYFFVLTLFNFLFARPKSPVTWIIWAVLIAAIPVGTSIAYLRHYVAEFFIALLFNDSLVLGMGLNLGLSLILIVGAWLFTRHRTF